MNAQELVERIEAIGGLLTLKGANIRYELPEDAAPMVDSLRQYRCEIVTLLRQRELSDSCCIHKTQTIWWARPDGSLVCERCHPNPNAVVHEEKELKASLPMPKGVTLLRWAPARPPVAIERWTVVNDVPRFIETTFLQLQAALAGKIWLAGNRSVRDLVERLEQVGVNVSVP